MKAGDRIQVTCTYDPTLAEELPILRRAPAHFVTFGDGSSDQMCVGLGWTRSSLPNPHSARTYRRGLPWPIVRID